MQGNKWTKLSLYNWYRVVFDEVKEVIPAARQWSCKTDQNIDSFNKQRTRMMLLTTKKKRDRWIIGIHWELVIFRLRLGKIRHSSVWQMMRLVKLWESAVLRISIHTRKHYRMAHERPTNRWYIFKLECYITVKDFNEPWWTILRICQRHWRTATFTLLLTF
jgi:hypothetical protein